MLRWLWAETGAESIGEALSYWPAATAPDEIQLAARRVLEARLSDHLGVNEADERAWRALLDFSERELDVLRERVFAEGDKSTLGELG